MTHWDRGNYHSGFISLCHNSGKTFTRLRLMEEKQFEETNRLVDSTVNIRPNNSDERLTSHGLGRPPLTPRAEQEPVN